MTFEPLTSGDSQNDARPATPDAGVQPERPAGRRPPPAAPVIALRMEGLLTWTAEHVAKFPRDHKFTVGDRLLETCLDVMAALTDAAYRRDKHEVLAMASRGLVRARILARLARLMVCSEILTLLALFDHLCAVLTRLAHMGDRPSAPAQIGQRERSR